MLVTVNKYDHVLVVAVSDRVDVTTSDELERRLRGAIAEGEKWIVLDLTHVEYASSAGLRVFVLAAKQCREKGGRLVFCGLNDFLQQLFRVTGLTLRYDVGANRNEAIAQLHEAGAASPQPT